MLHFLFNVLALHEMNFIAVTFIFYIGSIDFIAIVSYISVSMILISATWQIFTEYGKFLFLLQILHWLLNCSMLNVGSGGRNIQEKLKIYVLLAMLWFCLISQEVIIITTIH